jgi:hypothetical protein
LANASGAGFFLARGKQAIFHLISRNSIANFGSMEKPNSLAGNLPRFFFPEVIGKKHSAISEAAL